MIKISGKLYKNLRGEKNYEFSYIKSCLWYWIDCITCCISAVVVFYTSFYLPESLAKPSVSDHILHPAEEFFLIEIVPGAVTDGNDNYVPNKPTVLLTFTNNVKWINNDDTAHTVTPDHRYADGYSGDFGSPGVIKPGDSYEFLFTEPTVDSLFLSTSSLDER